ncbi:MAG: hypothetical protein LBU55_03345 [Elusimicrobiota bacterium]|jgi:hypothetical protein|nr:hypothetical protein [Elusimicrobiota bacterium]
MKKFLFALFLIIAAGFYIQVFSAVGCDLNDPDRDVKRFFPQSTSYKTDYFSISKLGGDELLKEVEKRLDDKFQGLYETIDVPYTLYTIFKDKEIIGYIHGINQKGLYGGLQVFLVYDIKGTVKNFYYQKLTSKAAKEFRSENFSKQFMEITLNDFKNYSPKTAQGGSSKVLSIKNPNTDDNVDFQATLRAVKKNLILTDIFVFSKKIK